MRVRTMTAGFALAAVLAAASEARASDVTPDSTKWCDRSQPEGASDSPTAQPEGICDVDPNAPGCGVSRIDMAEEAKKALKADIYALPAFPRCWGGCVDGEEGKTIGPAPARAMAGAAVVSAAAGTIFGALALRDLGDAHGSTSPKFQEGQTYMALSAASFLASAALAGLGIYLYVNRNRPLDWRGYFARVPSGVEF